MGFDSTPHDVAGDLEKGELDKEVGSSPVVETVSGRTPSEGAEGKSPPDSPGPDGARFPWNKRVASWVSSRSPTATDPFDMAPRKQPIVHSLETYPLGYPRMSCYLDSDEQFMIYRRFGTLHARCLLFAQDELRELEARLLRLDRLDDRDEDDRDYLMSRENDVDREPVEGREESRPELLARIKQKTVEYGQLLIQAQQLCAMNKPSWRDQRSVTNFIEAEAPLMEKDAEFIYHQEDLVTLRPGREHAWLDNAVENLLIWLRCSPIEYLFVSPLTRRKTENRRIRYYTRSRINLLVTAFITAIILALLVVPIYILFRITIESQHPGSGGAASSGSGNPATIGVLLVATLIFSAALSMFTKAKRHEILASAAAYCAVLVVFVGNVA